MEEGLAVDMLGFGVGEPRVRSWWWALGQAEEGDAVTLGLTLALGVSSKRNPSRREKT